MEIKDFCLAWADKKELEFIRRGVSTTKEDVFSHRGLMPAIAKRADKICMLVFGYGIGASFKKFEASTLGEEVTFSDSAPKIIQLHCFYYVISEMMITSVDDRGRVVVDELLYE